MTNFNPQALIVPSTKELAICIENEKQALEDDETTEQPQSQPLKESK